MKLGSHIDFFTTSTRYSDLQVTVVLLCNNAVKSAKKVRFFFFSVKSISRNFSWNRFQFRVEMEWIVLLHIRSRYTNFYNLHNFLIFRTLMKLATDRKSKELPAMSSIRALSKNMCSLIYFKSFTTKFKFDIEKTRKNVLCLFLMMLVGEDMILL